MLYSLLSVWPDIMNAIFTAFGIILSLLLGWGIAELIKWLKTKTNNEFVIGMIEEIAQNSSVAVQSTYQTYVEAIKGTDMWTLDAQKNALKMSLNTLKTQLSGSTLNFIKEKFGDIDKYLTQFIESAINKNKNA